MRTRFSAGRNGVPATLGLADDAHELPAALAENERQFLRALVRAEPDWTLLGIPHLAELPAIRWRLQNLQQLSREDPAKLRALCYALDKRFEELP
jgi:ABC-type thiamine transport system ATPase subunit